MVFIAHTGNEKEGLMMFEPSENSGCHSVNATYYALLPAV